MLSDTKIKKAKPKARQYKLYDSLGLFLIVTPKGKKWWRYRYRLHGKEKLLSLGVYNPRNVRTHVPLLEARAKRDEIAEQLKQGIDPSLQLTRILVDDYENQLKDNCYCGAVCRDSDFVDHYQVLLRNVRIL